MTTVARDTKVQFDVTFTINDNPTDPTAIAFLYRYNGGTVVTLTYALAEITKQGTGLYRVQLVLDTSGTFHFRWEGTGTVAAAVNGSVKVAADRFE